MPLYFDDLQPGQSWETAARTITEADVTAFAGISGDYNLIHTDAEFAKSTPFGQRIAHGLLVLSIVTGLRMRTGIFEGTVMAFMEITDWKFLRPVMFGDTIRARFAIETLTPTSKPDRGVARQKVEVLNQHNEVVQSGIFVTMIKRKGAA